MLLSVFIPSVPSCCPFPKSIPNLHPHCPFSLSLLPVPHRRSKHLRSSGTAAFLEGFCREVPRALFGVSASRRDELMNLSHFRGPAGAGAAAQIPGLSLRGSSGVLFPEPRSDRGSSGLVSRPLPLPGLGFSPSPGTEPRFLLAVRIRSGPIARGLLSRSGAGRAPACPAPPGKCRFWGDACPKSPRAAPASTGSRLSPVPAALGKFADFIPTFGAFRRDSCSYFCGIHFRLFPFIPRCALHLEYPQIWGF